MLLSPFGDEKGRKRLESLSTLIFIAVQGKEDQRLGVYANGIVCTPQAQTLSSPPTVGGGGADQVDSCALFYTAGHHLDTIFYQTHF